MSYLEIGKSSFYDGIFDLIYHKSFVLALERVPLIIDIIIIIIISQ